MKKIKNFQISKVLYSFIIIFFVLLSFFGSIYQLNLHYDGFHHGIVYLESVELLSGKLPYKDFFVHYGLLFVLINSFFLTIFNMSISALYYVSALFYSASILLLCILTKKYTNYLYACLVTVSIFLIHPFVYLPWPDYQLFFFVTLSLYFLSFNNKLSFFLSGIFLSFGILEKDFIIYIYLLVFPAIILIYFFLKFKKLVHFKIQFYRYFFLGFFIPISFLLFYLYINNLIPLYLKQLELPFLLTKISDTNAAIILINFFNLIKLSIRNFFFEPYWFFIILIIFTNIFFLINEIFLRKNKFYYQDFLLVIVSLFSVSLYLTAHFGAVFKLATGTVIGIIIIYCLISKVKSSETRYILNTLIILYLILGVEFGKSPSNLTYPNYKPKFKNSLNNIEFLRDKKFTKSQWNQLLLFKSKIDQVKKNCPNIEFGTNLTNDVFYTILMKKNFQIINFIPWYNEFTTYTPKLFDLFDPNFSQNFENLSNQRKLLIAVGNDMKIQDLINKDIYILNDNIKYDFYGHNNIQIYLPKNCKVSTGH